MKTFAALVLASIIMLYLNITPVVRVVRGYSSFLLNPISFIFVNGEKEAFEFYQVLTSLGQIKRENQVLRDSLQKTQSLLVISQTQQALDNYEQKQAEFLSQKGTVVSAEIIGSYENNGEVFFELNKGSESGISENSSVTNNGYLVGRVISSFPGKSVVKSAVNSKLDIPAKISGSESTGVFFCENNECFFDKVLNSNALQVGDIVVTSGVGGNFVSDLILGEVVNIDSSPEKLFKKATLTSFINLNQINRVVVISNE